MLTSKEILAVVIATAAENFAVPAESITPTTWIRDLNPAGRPPLAWALWVMDLEERLGIELSSEEERRMCTKNTTPKQAAKIAEWVMLRGASDSEEQAEWFPRRKHAHGFGSRARVNDTPRQYGPNGAESAFSHTRSKQRAARAMPADYNRATGQLHERSQPGSTGNRPYRRHAGTIGNRPQWPEIGNSGHRERRQ